jgi:hypothetical protein
MMDILNILKKLDFSLQKMTKTFAVMIVQEKKDIIEKMESYGIKCYNRS